VSDFPKAFEIASNRTLVIDNLAEHEGVSDRDRASLEALGMRSVVNATLRRGANAPLWAIVAGSMHPRAWTQSEISLVEEVAERTWAAVERARAEAAIRESEERFRLAIEKSKIAIYECDLDLRYTWITNPTPGFAAEDIVGRTDRELLSTNDAAQLEAFKRQALASETPLEQELHGSPSGERRLFLMRAERVLGEAGKAVGLRVVSLDITESRRVEEARRASEERLRLIVESAQDYAIFTTDRDDIIDEWMPGAAAVFGFTNVEAGGHPGAKILTPER
jgi:PAS domain S-box-containing protein